MRRGVVVCGRGGAEGFDGLGFWGAEAEVELGVGPGVDFVVDAEENVCGGDACQMIIRVMRVISEGIGTNRRGRSLRYA